MKTQAQYQREYRERLKAQGRPVNQGNKAAQNARYRQKQKEYALALKQSLTDEASTPEQKLEAQKLAEHLPGTLRSLGDRKSQAIRQAQRRLEERELRRLLPPAQQVHADSTENEESDADWEKRILGEHKAEESKENLSKAAQAMQSSKPIYNRHKPIIEDEYEE